MKHYLAALPGQNKQKPDADKETQQIVINTQGYKLIAKLREYRPDEWVITLSQWFPEQGWTHKQYFMSPLELANFRKLFE